MYFDLRHDPNQRWAAELAKGHPGAQYRDNALASREVPAA
jgi:hypothetical protein